MRPPLKHRPTTKKLLVKRGLAGLGLFAGEDIRRGAFIIEYWGPLLDQEEADRRGGLYLFQVPDSKWVVDGTSRKNTARYINHCCKPNCEVIADGNHLEIHAKRRIREGEELTYDYGEEYMDDVECKCSECRHKKKRRA